MQEDLWVVVINIVKLNEMYDLDVRDVFDGYIQDYVVILFLVEELYFIVVMVDKQDRMRSVVVWFEEFYRRIFENMYFDLMLKLIMVVRVLVGVYNKVCCKFVYGECLKLNFFYFVSWENLLYCKNSRFIMYFLFLIDWNVLKID